MLGTEETSDVKAGPSESSSRIARHFTIHYSVTGHRETELVLTKKLPPCELFFTVQAAREKSRQQSHPAINLMSYSND